MKVKKISNNHKEKLHIHKAKIIAIIAMISCMAITVVVWAKFINEKYIKINLFNHNIATYYMDVVVEDITGQDQTKTLSEKILIDEINPGDTRKVEFYVRNGNGTNISDVEMDYEIELIHTDNMPLKYNLYDEEGNLLDGTALTDTEKLYKNDGTRIKYEKSKENENFVLKIDKEEEANFDSHKYVLEIFWEKDDESANFKYVKEIDFLYVNVYAYESNPLNS